MPMREAGQGVRAIAAVAGEDELAVGEPMDQDRQQLPHQFRGRLVPPRRGRGRAAGSAAWSWPWPWSLALTLALSLAFLALAPGPWPSGLLGAAIQRHQDRQRPGPGGEGELDQDRQDDPFVPPAIGGEGVGRAHRVAMTALAVDLGAAVLVDGIVAGQEDGPVGDPMIEDERRPGCEPVGARTSVASRRRGDSWRDLPGPDPGTVRSRLETVRRPVVRTAATSRTRKRW